MSCLPAAALRVLTIVKPEDTAIARHFANLLHPASKTSVPRDADASDTMSR